MQGKIIKPTHLEMCHCGKHGRFRLSNGHNSSELVAQDFAVGLLRQMANHKIVLSVELPGIIEQITGSSLPRYMDEVPTEFNLRAAKWNELHSTPESFAGGVDVEEIHAALMSE